MFEQLLHRKLEKLAYENNDKEIDWNDKEQPKFTIMFNNITKDVGYIWSETCNRDYGQVYFLSEEICNNAIKKFQYDLTRYFTTDK